MASTKQVKKPLSRVEQVRKRQRKLFIFRITLISLLCVSLLVGFVFLMRARFLQIDAITTLGTRSTVPEELVKTARESLLGSYLWVFPKTNIFFFPKKQLIKNLLIAYPRLATVATKVKPSLYTSSLTLSVTERTQTYLWCSGDPDTSAPCYYLDPTGLVFARAPEISGTVYFKFFGGELNTLPDPINHPMITPLAYRRYLEFKDSLEAAKVFGLGVEIISPTEAHFLLSRELAKDRMLIRVRTTDDPATVAGNLSAALVKEPLKSLFNFQKERIEYIDLRFPNKVYFRPGN